MACPACLRVVPLDSEFCSHCGVKLYESCWRCGSANRVGDHACVQCGEPVAPQGVRESRPMPSHHVEQILTSRRALEGERKVVTVLFADVQGSLELIAGRDPEDVRRVLDGVLGQMIDAVQAYDGAVNQVLGDGIMALFGAPLAREDHAVRACHAALAIREAVQRYAVATAAPEPIHLRIGLNSGDVVVRSIRSDLRMDYTAIGETTHLAARMEQSAPPDTILLAEETRRLAGPWIETTALGPRAVRGLSRQISVFELHGRAHPPSGWRFLDPQALAGLVGREAELAILDQALKRSRADGARIIGVAGDAGVGKSRLCFEFVQRCAAQGLRVCHVVGTAHGNSMPFFLLTEFLRTYLGIAEDADDQQIRACVTERLLGDDLLEACVPLALEALGVEKAPPGDDGGRSRWQLLQGLAHLLRREAKDAFTLMLVEDLHWLDGGSEMLVDALAHVMQGSNAMLVVNFRPPYVREWMQSSSYQSLTLAALAPEAARVLVWGLLGQAPSVAFLGEQVLARADGNPFFIEELVQSMVQRGSLVGRRGAYEADERVSRVDLPATIQAVLSSRIDRLRESDRDVLQAAAVIGREFSPLMLTRLTGVADEPLRGIFSRLVADGFIVERSADGETTYAFRHPLTQEVAYQSQLSERRRRVHEEVARILEETLGPRRNELAGLTAFHYEAARQIQSAAKFWARAALWIGSSNPSQAMDYWRHVRELLRGVESPPDLVYWRIVACGQLLTLGWRRGMSAADAAEVFEEAASLAQMSGAVLAHALLLTAYGRILVTRGSAEEFVAQMEAARALTESSGDGPIRVCITGALAQAHLIRGDLPAALAANDEAIEGLRRTGAFDPRIVGFNLEPWLLGMRAELLVYMARLDEAASLLKTVIPLAAAERDPTVQLFPHTVGGELAAARGDVDLAVGHADVARDLAARHETAHVQVYAAATRALAHLITERWEEAIVLVSDALAHARATGSGLEHEARLLVYLAYGHLELGRPAPATAAAEEALAIAVERGRLMAEGQAWLVLAAARLASGADPPAALEALERAEMLLQQTGAAVHEPYLAVLRSRLAGASGDAVAAAEWRRKAAQHFTRLGARRYAERLQGSG